MKQFIIRYFLALIFVIFAGSEPLSAQMITGVWKGKINKKKVELKIVQSGDSLEGTSYYYESGTSYRRFSIKGYFDPNTNSAVWWDDQLLEEKTGRLKIGAGTIPYLSTADFNCPGSGKMYLDGKASHKDDSRDPKGPVDLEKIPISQFNDEWDFVIENYTTGANDPYIIDSVAAISSYPTPNPSPIEEVVINRPDPVLNKPINERIDTRKDPVSVNPPAEKRIIQSAITIEDKFIHREKILTTEIPLSGDSLELRFYDNAEIDGDSISLFLNDKLIFEHIRLTGNPYIIKLPVSDLKDTNELIMVAENLGSIPPNTSYMIAIVGEKRYNAQLASTERSSAMIRLVKNQ